MQPHNKGRRAEEGREASVSHDFEKGYAAGEKSEAIASAERERDLNDRISILENKLLDADQAIWVERGQREAVERVLRNLEADAFWDQC